MTALAIRLLGLVRQLGRRACGMGARRLLEALYPTCEAECAFDLMTADGERGLLVAGSATKLLVNREAVA
jgi:hypothetical protein